MVNESFQVYENFTSECPTNCSPVPTALGVQLGCLPVLQQQEGNCCCPISK